METIMAGRMNEPDWNCVSAAWDEMRNQRMIPARTGYDPEFRAKLAEDHREIAGYNNYEYGRRAVEALGEILNKDSMVLEVGAGPGTLTIPLAKVVKQIVVVESYGMAIASLKKNLAAAGVENVEIREDNWLKVDKHELGGDLDFDLVVCSHFLWQMKDLKEHLAKMEAASGGYCAVIQPAGRDDMAKGAWTEITGEPYAGQFDPDADYFAYLLLRRLGRLVDVQNVNYSMKRDFEQEVRYVASFIGRYVEVDSRVKEQIEQYVSQKEIREETQSAVVMWWRA